MPDVWSHWNSIPALDSVIVVKNEIENKIGEKNKNFKILKLEGVLFCFLNIGLKVLLGRLDFIKLNIWIYFK